MPIYNLSPIVNPQYVPHSAAAQLNFATLGSPVVVPASANYQISVLRVANKTAAPVQLTVWRVPATKSADDEHLVLPAIYVPVATQTMPHMDLLALWGAILQPGDSIYTLAGASSSLIIQGDGAVITI